MDDPSLNPPPESKADWIAEIEKFRQEVSKDDSVPDDELIRLLHEALVNRVEDTRVQEDHKARIITRLEDGVKERDRSRKDSSLATAAIAKLEGTCRQLQQEKIQIGKENQRIADEEQTRHQDMKDKFQEAIKDVQEKMDAELEVRQHFLKENEDLRGKLQKFTETYEEQEQQLAEQQEARAKEMQVAQQRLREHEVMTSESRTKTGTLEKQNEVLRKSQTVLRDELQAILNKFDEFHEAVTGSNQRHGECKAEIDTLQSRLQELEKENADLREGKTISELSEEQKVAQKQRDALEKLCDNLQKENKKSTDQLRKLRSAG
jgi:chromosome segregation ATPase